MDYPKSVPGVGLVDGKFVDEDQTSGTPGSLIPSVWGNAVTDELVALITAAGLAPSEADRTQVLAAVRELAKEAPKRYGVGARLDLRDSALVDITAAPSTFYGRGTLHGFANGGTGGDRPLSIPALGAGPVYGVCSVHAPAADAGGLQAMAREFRTGGRVFISSPASESAWGDWLEVFTSGNLQDATALAALAFPSIVAANSRLEVTATAVAGNGGTVSVPAGVRIVIAEELDAGATGRMRTFTTPAWASASLATNSTYYLRANVQAGALTFYVGTGADTDAIPASLRGAAGSTGCGFDSTVLDVLVAKVVTGAAGTAPTVTALANKHALRVDAAWQGARGTYTWPLNWARKPRGYVTSFADFDGNVKTDYSVVIEPVGNNSSGAAIAPAGGFADRYNGRIFIASYIPSVGDGYMNCAVRWEA